MSDIVKSSGGEKIRNLYAVDVLTARGTVRDTFLVIAVSKGDALDLVRKNGHVGNAELEVERVKFNPGTGIACITD